MSMNIERRIVFCLNFESNFTKLYLSQRNYLIRMLTNPEDIRMEYLGIEKTKPNGSHIFANLPENKPTNRLTVADHTPHPIYRVNRGEGLCCMQALSDDTVFYW